MREAEKLAINNFAINPKMHTVLFFDEANTTEAIGVIKEVMCDKTLNGRPIDTAHGLQLIAACNPYRKLVIFLVMWGVGIYMCIVYYTCTY